MMAAAAVGTKASGGAGMGALGGGMLVSARRAGGRVGDGLGGGRVVMAADGGVDDGVLAGGEGAGDVSSLTKVPCGWSICSGAVSTIEP